MFENVPYFNGYNPYYNSNFQQPQRNMQNQNYMQQQNGYPGNNGNYNNSNQINNYTPQNTLKGRIVTNIEEVKGILIEPDGNIYYFPCLAENCIYTKTIDLNAQSVINVYKLSIGELPEYADSKMVKSLDERLTNIEKMMKGSEKNDKSNAND